MFVARAPLMLNDWSAAPNPDWVPITSKFA